MSNQSLADRLWARVDRSGEGCWLWQGCTHAKGYGILRDDRGRAGRAVRAHRVAYELTYGPIPDGLLVCHRCDNPRCCRPDHLFLGSPLVNSTDMRVKNRPRGRYRTTPEPALGIEDALIPAPETRDAKMATRLRGRLSREKVKR